MAPWPEQGNEPKAPDKSCSKSGENSSSETTKVHLGASEDAEVNATANKSDDKQVDERNPDVSNLDDGQLRALLDEAITYKRPKDREGKSDLFRELLQEAEADETECGESRRGLGGSGAGGSRYYSNSSRRRGRRDAAVSERPTRGGSLQNLVHASNSEFDTSFSGYFTTGSSHGGRRKSKRSGGGGAGCIGGVGGGRDCGVNVSARQREGGSLPSNVNVGGMLTLSGLEYHHPSPTSLPFEEVRFCANSAKPAKRKDPLVHTTSSNDFVSMPVHVSAEVNSSSSPEVGGRQTGNTARYLMAPKTECMVIDLGHCAESDDDEPPPARGVVLDDAEKRNGAEEEGTEMEVLQRAEVTARVPNYTSHATLEVGLGDVAKKTETLDVDSMVTSPLRLLQCEKSGVVNGVEQSHLQLSSSYNSVKCFMGSTGSSRDDRTVSASGKGSSTVLNLLNGLRMVNLVNPASFQLSGGDISKRSSSGTGEAGKAATGVVHNMYPMQQHHLSVLSLTPHNWVTKPLCPGKTATVASERACLRASLASDVNRLTSHGGSKECSGEAKPQRNAVKSEERGGQFTLPNLEYDVFGIIRLLFSKLQSQNKALDENGNAVNRVDSSNSNSNERKGKQRKTKTNNDRNVIMSQNIEGHRGDKDIESLIDYIESTTDSKGKGTKSTTSHSNGPVTFSNKQQRNSNSSNSVVGGTKPRRERGGDEPLAEEERNTSGGKNRAGKQVTKEHRGGKGSKLKKSNSLEEISKTKLEDLTSSSGKEKGSSEGGGSVASGSGGDEGGNSLSSSSVLVRRTKKQTTVDDGEFTRVGDRRSWGTEEGQQYYCNDVTVTVSADESSSGSIPSQGNRKRRGAEERRRSERDEGAVTVSMSGASEETEFHVVTKKQRRKKRRSSSGGRGTVMSGMFFSDDSRRSGTVPMYNSHVTTSSSSYYQPREGNSSGGQSYYQRKTLTGANSGFPPHDRTVELYQYRHHRPRSPDHLRRKSTSSMPPSDKSDSSDLDSVHSLPVSSTTPKLALDQTSTSSGSTPQASYADIARMASTNIIPTAPSQPQHGNINLNPGRWPAVTAPKSASPSAPPPPPPVSSSGAIPMAPVPSPSNPQFITGGPKLNIGTPPVSGSKVSSNPSGGSGHSTVPPPSSSVSAEDSLTSQPSVQKEAESSLHPPGADTTLPSIKSRPILSDPRTKKDAMTNTTMDYKLIPPYSADEPSNILSEGEYPSLEESLVSCKIDSSKSGKYSHNTPLSNQVLSPDNNVSAIVTFSLNTEPSKVSRHQGNVVSEPDTTSSDNKDSSKRVTSSVVEASVEATVVIPRRHCAPECVAASQSGHGHVSTSSVIVNANKPMGDKEAAVSSNKTGRGSGACNKKVSGNVRPPVILMDEAEQEGTVYGEITFGFEVNEQLLLSEGGDEGEESTSTPVQKELEEDKGRTASEEVAYVSTAVLLPSTPVAATSPGNSKAGEEFSARYREPTTQADNHDKIVTFVGLAWDDVLKEMNCTPVHSGSKIRYYSGQ
ncbi:uncharacterized protein tyf isoform X3 [Anabrus simplex]|uniref:uncharacterized protein tyf isoform X3 n=1 Tax=Anabrus simplex TaxID=316456 RepID=UPI0035A32F8D